ncbi:MAG: hypothetical protein HKO81_05505 [Flavobacteriaceae bacterium]|nr:hypothetical protein [Flavobacteriaceae bacterium]
MTPNKVIRFIPEVFMLLSVIYYWSLTGSLRNLVAIVLILLLLFQIITRTRVTGIIISSIFVLLNCYLILALLSELNEFSTFNSDAKKLAFFGFSYITLNIIMGASMLVIYLVREMSNKSNIIGDTK